MKPNTNKFPCTEVSPFCGNLEGGFGTRYYSPDLSIWLSVDPLAHISPHQSPYVYCANNPIRLIDPNGMDEFEIQTKNGFNDVIII